MLRKPYSNIQPNSSYSLKEIFVKSDDLAERQTRGGNDSKFFRCIEDCQKCLLESQAISISGILIFAWDLGFKMVMVKLLKVTPAMRMMKNITQQVLQ